MAALGLWFLAIGLFKKVVIANALATHVDRLYGQRDSLLTVVSGWAAALGYALQLYFDFSRLLRHGRRPRAADGAALPAELQLALQGAQPERLLAPLAHEPVPLADRLPLHLARRQPRSGKLKTLRNLFLTMFLGGLWHGAAWVFVLWGVGSTALRSSCTASPRRRASSRRGSGSARLMLLRLRRAPVGAVPLRQHRAGEDAAQSTEVMSNMLAAMFGANGFGLGHLSRADATGLPGPSSRSCGLIAALLVFVNVAPNTWEFKFRPTRKLALATAVLATWSVLHAQRTQPVPVLPVLSATVSGTSVIDVARPTPSTSRCPARCELPPRFAHATFVRWLLAATLAGRRQPSAAVNWYVDPTGVTGRSTRWLVAENSEVRSAKLDLYDDAARARRGPQVLLLGSSRTMKFDPADVERADGRARVQRRGQRWRAARRVAVRASSWRSARARTFPHLVWGLDADAFRDKQLRDGLSTDPRMSRFVPRSERIGDDASRAPAR